MGDVIKDFYKSDAPQFRGRSKEKRREMAIAAKLTAERGEQVKEQEEMPMSAAEIALQKRKARIQMMIAKKRQQTLQTVDKDQKKEEVEHLDEMPYQVYGSPDGKKEKKIGKPVKSRKYADARAAELADTHKKTGGKYRSEYTEATYPSDFINPDGSKRAVAKKKTGRPVQHDQPTDKYGRRKTVDESAEDRLRDQRMERGGVAGNVDYRRPAKNAATGSKKKYDGMSALAKVKAELEKKHGKGSVK